MVHGNPGFFGKHIAGLAYAGSTGGLVGQSPSVLGMPNPALWTGVKAIEQHWLQQQSFDPMPSSETVTRWLDPVPGAIPGFQPPEWWQGVLEASQTVGSYFSQIKSMVETVADTMASPLAGVMQLGEHFARPIQGWQQLVSNLPSFWNFEGFWEGLQPFLRNIEILLQDAETGREVLKASEFGFADHFWGVFYVRGFAHIDPQVRNAFVTNKLFSFTRSEIFVEQLRSAVEGSKLLRKRWRIIKLAWEAHAEGKYALAVPAILTQIEGTLVNLMFLKDLVKIHKGRFHLVDENGNLVYGKKSRPITLHPAITNAKLDEHPNLGAASEFVADTLVQRRNAVLHGHDLSYGTRKFSVQALLILAVLATAVSRMESGNISPPALP